MKQFSINKIHFLYENSLALRQIDIRVLPNENAPTLNVKEIYCYHKPKLDKSTPISLKQFKEIQETISVLYIPKPFDKTVGLDGSNWLLEYEMGGETKSFEV